MWISNLKPKFWDHVGLGWDLDRHQLNFRKIWKVIVLLTLGVALIPLVVMAIVDYRVSREAMESDILLRTARLVSNTRRTISYFLIERKAALDFINHYEQPGSLVAPEGIERILEGLKKGFGGFVDLGVINDRGIQSTYRGPYKLAGKNYSDANWFKEVSEKGVHISDVFMGIRNVPHMVIAVKHNLPTGGFYVLRATLDTARLNDLLSGLEMGGQGDAFIINRKGVLQTRSRYHGGVLDQLDLPVPDYSERSQVQVLQTARSGALVIGYAYIAESPFILMVVKHKGHLMAAWNKSRTRIIVFLIFSVAAIMVVLLGGITFLVNQIYLTEQRRLRAMHEAEYANKLAALGRLSAGVAHEINNPLAIINEKAGLIKDLFTFRDDYAKDAKLMQSVDSIISSVARCAGITRRLLNFARHSEIKPVDLKELILEVLGFVEKETEYRSIDLLTRFDENLPLIESDSGRLQEIFLNLISNALAAVEDGGHLEVAARVANPEWVEIRFSDDGYGIPEGDLDRVFEPFFSTKAGKGGTGLGLSITYGLVQELGGRIRVESKVGEGTTFTVTLPLNPPRRQDKETAHDDITERST
jgi:two-component system NtrC family sensor kinase